MEGKGGYGIGLIGRMRDGIFFCFEEEWIWD